MNSAAASSRKLSEYGGSQSKTKYAFLVASDMAVLSHCRQFHRRQVTPQIKPDHFAWIRILGTQFAGLPCNKWLGPLRKREQKVAFEAIPVLAPSRQHIFDADRIVKIYKQID